MSVVVSTLKYAGNCTECAIATEGREASLSTYAPHTSEMPIPNCMGRHYGPAIDHHREQACNSFSRLLDVAYSVSIT